jgi:hypothetical protein
MPVQHGWVMRRGDGAMIDLTWRDNVGLAYIGVPFHHSYVMRCVREREMWGTLLDNYWQRHPLLTGEHALEEALFPLNQLPWAQPLEGATT